MNFIAVYEHVSWTVSYRRIPHDTLPYSELLNSLTLAFPITETSKHVVIKVGWFTLNCCQSVGRKYYSGPLFLKMAHWIFCQCTIGSLTDKSFPIPVIWNVYIEHSSISLLFHQILQTNSNCSESTLFSLSLLINQYTIYNGTLCKWCAEHFKILTSTILYKCEEDAVSSDRINAFSILTKSNGFVHFLTLYDHNWLPRKLYALCNHGYHSRLR